MFWKLSPCVFIVLLFLEERRLDILRREGARLDLEEFSYIYLGTDMLTPLQNCVHPIMYSVMAGNLSTTDLFS